MNVYFDAFGIYEKPAITLCNPNKEEIYSLGLCFETKMTRRFGAIGEFQFKFPESIDGGDTVIDAYYYLQNKRIVLINGFGYFQIVDVSEDRNGAVPTKSVTCKSLENELTQKRVTVYSGTKALYNPISPDGTILGDMVLLAPGWSVSSVDGELTTKFRTFKISDTTVYKFLVDDVGKAFECVFIFDTVNRTISAKTLENATSDTDVFLSFDNLIKDSKFSEKSDEITTCLSVYGGGNLTIRGVNPLGTNKIYNFDYYATPEWMSQSLITAIDNWKSLVASKEIEYSSFLLSLKNKLSTLIILKSKLDTLMSEYSALETIQKVRIEDGQPYSDITAQMVAKQSQIDNQNTLISNKESSIAAIESELDAITLMVSFEENFTENQLLELSSFIYENTYKNDNIIQTDIMTNVEIQEAQLELYSQAKDVLSRVSQPRYEIDFDMVNYTALFEYGIFTSQTDVGMVATIELKSGSTIESVLLEFSISFDDPSMFSMSFSNRLRLDNGNFIYSDLMGQVVETGASVAFNSEQWSNWNENYRDDVTTFINSSLNTANNELINSVNQEIVINQNGLKGRKYIPATSSYDSSQVWLTSSILAFTDDSWNTAKLALGKISTPSGGTAYGLVADVIVGRLVAGNNLRISNESNSFILDNTGAYLTNASLTITKSNSKIYIDPTEAFKIQQNSGGTWVDRFKVDSLGNVVFSGTLSGASGTFSGAITATSGSIGGWTINSTGISDSLGNYIRSNGQIKLGAMTINGSTSTFNGNIYADKIFGQVQNSQIATGIDASKVTFGTIGAGVVYAGSIEWSGVRMYPYGYGWAMIEGQKIEIASTSTNGGAFSVSAGTASINSGDAILMYAGNVIEMESNSVWVSNNSSSGYGVTTTLNPSSLSGMEFVNGILVNYY